MLSLFQEFFRTILKLPRHPLLKTKKILKEEVKLFNKQKSGGNGKKEVMQCVVKNPDSEARLSMFMCWLCHLLAV